MVDRPPMELLSRMAVHHCAAHPRRPVEAAYAGRQRWKRERAAIIQAVLDRNPERARFEAQRRRRGIMSQLAAPHDPDLA
jgi:hypothetical protein